MNWLIDAQLPRRLALKLVSLGHDAVHTLDLPQGNRTSDSDLCRIADSSGRILVSKDRDFLDSFYVNAKPARLLWITTGNIANTDLLARIELLLPDLEVAFSEAKCVEMTAFELIVHR